MSLSWAARVCKPQTSARPGSSRARVWPVRLEAGLSAAVARREPRCVGSCERVLSEEVGAANRSDQP
eukprot:3871365-Pyramimonas_sp.AAC.1